MFQAHLVKQPVFSPLFPLTTSIVPFMNSPSCRLSFPTSARRGEARFNSQRAIAISRGGKGAETCARSSRTRSMRHKRLIYLTHSRRRRRPSAVCTKERRVTTLSVPLFKTNNRDDRTFRL